MKKLKQEEFFEFPTRGLFIDDYSKLPKLTTDLEQAKSDIDIYGYCMLKEALSPEQVKHYAALLWSSLVAHRNLRASSDLGRQEGLSWVTCRTVETNSCS